MPTTGGNAASCQLPWLKVFEDSEEELLQGGRRHTSGIDRDGRTPTLSSEESIIALAMARNCELGQASPTLCRLVRAPSRRIIKRLSAIVRLLDPGTAHEFGEPVAINSS